MSASRSTDLRRTVTRACIPLVVATVALAAVELLLRARPDLIPAGYRGSFPSRGIEFFEPGLLSRTSIDALPLPLERAPFTGIPPADLKEAGIAPAEVDHDRTRFPRVLIPADARGLPNREAVDHADVVLVGDSFVVSGATLHPEGLAVQMAVELRRSVYTVALAGIGPPLEAWLLEHVGMALEPRLVLWFFFGGNDLNDARKTVRRRAEGRRMRADLEDYRPPPRFVLPGLLRWLVDSESSPPDYQTTLPPFELAADPGEVWFHPRYLARLAIRRGEWEGHVAWNETTDLLRRSRDLVHAGGARFALVYLPSKAEALLPVVRTDAELILRYLNHGLIDPLDIDPAQALARLEANRTALDEALASFAADEGIPYFSATTSLTDFATRGGGGYLSTDTHWCSPGQEAALGPMIEFLRENGLLEE